MFSPSDRANELVTLGDMSFYLWDIDSGGKAEVSLLASTWKSWHVGLA